MIVRHSAPPRAGRPVALVVEGGATRAAYASGVAESLQRAGFEPAAIYGTSAGGAIGAWYAAGQAHVGATTWERVTDRTLLSYRRGLLGAGPVLDFRRLYGELYRHHWRLDVERLRASPYPVFVTVTDADTAETLHVDLRTVDDPFHLLHATSAIPFVSEAPVLWAGRRLVDGGTTDPIPVAKALADGHRDVVVVSNRPPGPRRPEGAVAVALVARKLPALAEATRERHLAYNRAIALAQRPPEGVRARLVRPARDLGVGRFTRDLATIARAIDAGRADGLRLAREMGLPAAAAAAAPPPAPAR